MWLWQGWWPESHEAEKDTNTITGSGMIRWHAERRAAMQTITEWAKLKYGGAKRLPAELVWAGCESLEFTSMFPAWTERPGVKELNKKVILFKIS